MACNSSRKLFLISVILVSFLGATTTAQRQACLETGNYTSNSTYRANLETLLSSLSSHNQLPSGFINSSLGEGPDDRVYAFALCRGDETEDDCRSCVNSSSIQLLRGCPNQKAAFGWYETCMIRYSDESMYGVMRLSPTLARVSSFSVPINKTVFDDRLKTLLDRLRDEAASGDSLLKVAWGSITTPTLVTLYAISQCSPDLSRIDCANCLDTVAGYIPQCCDNKEGARAYTPSCYLRYDTNIFYNPIVRPRQESPPAASTKGKRNKSSQIVTIIVIPTVSLVTLVICISIIIFSRARKSWQNVLDVDPDEIKSAESLQFDFSTIRAATDNFSDENKLGQGGFGAVYKGQLPNGQNIAVKRLSATSGQGDTEFKNEVLLVAMLQHRNLVRLLGFSLHRNERLLIYEFLPNRSLDYYIFDNIKRATLNWEMRYKIIGGIARGLLYLHEDSRHRIIHRDLKASNILLDHEMNSKISDFGMARLFVVDQTQGATSRIVGTYGYMAPEYAMHGQFSVKSDVFSFGVLVLEIISGQKNYCFRHGDNVEDLMSYAWNNWRAGTPLNLVDSTFGAAGSRSEMMKCIQIGLLCVQENLAQRPTMASVVLMLNSDSVTLQMPTQPAFFMRNTIAELENSGIIVTGQSQNRVGGLSINEVTITELYPR